MLDCDWSSDVCSSDLAVVGTGGADKNQIAFMIARLLPTAGSPTADAADALAVAITHAHARTARRVA
jgi:crossover junction endodeoxyribonuclease RuvC